MPQHRHHHHHQKRGYHIATTQAAPQPISNHENVSYYDTQVSGFYCVFLFYIIDFFQTVVYFVSFVTHFSYFFFFKMVIQYIQQKPKSWDNLAMKAIGGYGFGYGYLEKANTKARTNVTSSGTVRTHFMEADSQILYSSQGLANNRNLNEIRNANHQHNTEPRKNPSGRYSLLNIENYAPPPSQFVQEFAATTTTTSFTKSTDNLLDASNTSINSCECNGPETQNKILKHKQQSKECLGYYSNLPKTVCKTMPPPTKAKTNDSMKNCETVNTISEITRL